MIVYTNDIKSIPNDAITKFHLREVSFTDLTITAITNANNINIKRYHMISKNSIFPFCATGKRDLIKSVT